MTFCSGAARPASPRSRGGRPTTPALLAADALAAGFAGLPPGMTRWTLMRALRNAAPAMGLAPRALQLLETYIEWTYDADWAPGAEPIVVTPLTETAETLGLSERQVRNIETALMRAGLLTFRDSGNHARRGRRCRRTGRLLQGFGPSLAPLAARAAEIAERAAAARAEVAACR
ncbi:MAG: helix-turn-helix domain-containing protein, partial [Rubrimonas sp.]